MIKLHRGTYSHRPVDLVIVHKLQRDDFIGRNARRRLWTLLRPAEQERHLGRLLISLKVREVVEGKVRGKERAEEAATGAESYYLS